MENIFGNSNFEEKEPEIRDEKTLIIDQYDNIKENYKEIFVEGALQIRTAIDKLKPENNPCTICTKKCNLEKIDIFTDFPVGCAYREWQAQTLSFLNGEYKQKLKKHYQLMMDKKNNYECNKCGDCCRLAVSEYSYEQLKQRAFRGDKYSKDFVSVFVPYNSEEEAKQANPEYFEALGDLVDDKTYYYYCPKLKDNMCSDYENRPDICKDFPHNPLKLLPSRCSFNVWRNEIAKESMLLKAKTDIIAFYMQKLG